MARGAVVRKVSGVSSAAWRKREQGWGVLVFGNYPQTGEEGDSFEVGRVLTLDGASGFFDEPRAFQPGERLFLLMSGEELRSASETAFESPQRFRDLLHSAPLITATWVESGILSAHCRIERCERFFDVYGRKERTGRNEVLDVVAEYDEMWRQTREAVHRMGDAYRYSFWRQLPSVSAVRESVRRGLVATKRRWDSTFLLESFPEGEIVRVVVYGPYEQDSSRIYDIVDADEYEAAIRRRAADAALKSETRFWNSLFD
jgi:hypothetical protein